MVAKGVLFQSNTPTHTHLPSVFFTSLSLPSEGKIRKRVERGGKGGRLEREESQREEVHSRRLSLHVERWKNGNEWGFVLRYPFQHLSCSWLRTILGEERKRVLRERVALQEEGGDHKRTGLSFSFRIYVKTRVRNTTRRTNPQSGRDRD